MRWVPGPRGLDPLLNSWDSRVCWPCRFLPADRSRSWWSATGGGWSADRGLAEATVVRYVKLARPFLRQRSRGSVESVNLTGTDIVAFLLQNRPLSVGSVKGRVAELRSLLKFLYLQGFDAATAGHRGAAGRRLARHRGPRKLSRLPTWSCCWIAATGPTRSAFATSRC